MTPEKPVPTIKRRDRQYVGATLIILVDLYRHAFKVGLEETTESPQPTTVARLENYATTAVRAASLPGYQPSKLAADALAEAGYRETKSRRAEREEQAANAEARIRERRLAVANHGATEVPPAVPVVLAAAVVAAVALCIALTAQTAIFGKLFRSSAKSVVLSAMSGLVVAIPLVASTLASIHWPNIPRRLVILRPLVAGIFALGLLLVRGIDTTSVGIFLVEAALLVTLEAFVWGEHTKWREYVERARGRSVAQERLEAEVVGLTRAETVIAACEEREDQHHDTIEERDFSSRSLDAASAAAIAAALLGYEHSVSARKSRRTGASIRLPTVADEITALLMGNGVASAPAAGQLGDHMNVLFVIITTSALVVGFRRYRHHRELWSAGHSRNRALRSRTERHDV